MIGDTSGKSEKQIMHHFETIINTHRHQKTQDYIKQRRQIASDNLVVVDLDSLLGHKPTPEPSQQNGEFDYFLCTKKGHVIDTPFGAEDGDSEFGDDSDDSQSVDRDSQDSNRESAEANDYPDEEIMHSDDDRQSLGYGSEDDDEEAAAERYNRN